MPEGWQWLPVLLGLWALYEIWRALIVGFIKRRYERHVDQFLRRHDIPVDPFRHAHRVVVKERVMADPGLVAAIAARAEADGVTQHDVQDKVRAYLDEIVPQFNLLAYYKVGYRIGRMAAYSTYNVLLDKPSLAAAQAKIPEGASVVYVSNHRSNADFIVTGFMLSRSVQISYAVGEWARVWPLESLFKAFGSYFVRRGEKDPLYHRTLEAYLQLITKQGVTQAMFPEGGLSRDGALRPAKVGLLDNMAKATLDMDRPLVFVPVGINFDRVMEDDNMVYEAKHGRPKYHKRTVWQKIGRLFSLIGKLLWGWPINIARFLAKRMKKHGVVAIHFGEPIQFDAWYKGKTKFLTETDRHKRWSKLQPFADDLLAKIGDVVPATPVTITCLALTRLGEERVAAGVDRGSILMALREAQDELAGRGRPMATGDPYLERHTGRNAALAADVDAAEERARIFERALDVLQPRILDEQAVTWRATRWDLVEYYANSLRTE